MTHPLQENPRLKEIWLRDAKDRFPLGTRVRVTHSDVPEYLGLAGTVTDYDIGLDGDWPIISVRFDEPKKIFFSGLLDEMPGDSFYDDELEIIT